MSDHQQELIDKPTSKKPTSRKLRHHENAFGVFKTAEQQHTWHKDRVVMVEDVLVDLCCSKSLITIGHERGRGPRLLNQLIAQFSLHAMHYCKWKNVNMPIDFTDKVAQRYVVLARDDYSMEDARQQVAKVQEVMQKLACGVPLQQIFGEQGGSAVSLNIRIAIFGIQALSTLKDVGVEKDVVLEAIAKMMSGMDGDQACQEAVAENEEKLKAKKCGAATDNAEG